ncbi:hypothetical protein [Paraburkholderia solisilvae]|nr:hypothetical protein [Paraburkholderia solisilvae]
MPALPRRREPLSLRVRKHSIARTVLPGNAIDIAGLGEVMLRNFFDSISRWFENSWLERRDEYLASAKTLEELEQRMRDTDRWMGP